jgi:hypothetical protein
MDWSERYLILAIAVFVLTVFSRDIGKVLLGGTLLLAWVNENYWFNTLGQPVAWVPIAATDIAFASVTTVIGLEYKVRRLGALMVALYGAREALQIVALWQNHGYMFWAGLNIAYSLQLLMLGGCAGYGLARPFIAHLAAGLRRDGVHVLSFGSRSGFQETLRKKTRRQK